MYYDGTTVTVGIVTGISVTLNNSTDFITQTAHGYSNLQRISFYGTLPTEIEQGRFYYVRNKTTDTYQVSLTE